MRRATSDANGALTEPGMMKRHPSLPTKTRDEDPAASALAMLLAPVAAAQLHLVGGGRNMAIRRRNRVANASACDLSSDLLPCAETPKQRKEKRSFVSTGNGWAPATAPAAAATYPDCNAIGWDPSAHGSSHHDAIVVMEDADLEDEGRWTDDSKPMLLEEFQEDLGGVDDLPPGLQLMASLLDVETYGRDQNSVEADILKARKSRRAWAHCRGFA